MMSIQHAPEVGWVISQVVPVLCPDESIVNSDDGDVIVLADFFVGHTVVILKTAKTVVIIVPNDRLVEQLDDTDSISPLGSIEDFGNTSNDTGCKLKIGIIVVETDISSVATVVITVLCISKFKFFLAIKSMFGKAAL